MLFVCRHPQFTGLISTSPNKIKGLTHTASLRPVRLPAVVGYQTAPVRQYLSVQLPTFDGVAVTGIDIQSIKPAAEEFESGDFTIQIYNEVGAQTASYMYCIGEEIGQENDGWYEEDLETLVVKTFDVGEAFNVYAAKEGGLTYAGQVVPAQVVVPVRQYLSAQGNFRPIAVNIQDIIPAATEETMESGDFTLQIYNEVGAQTASYMYCIGEEIGQEKDGWYEEDLETLVEKTFAAGEGFNIYAAKEGTLTFPALSL